MSRDEQKPKNRILNFAGFTLEPILRSNVEEQQLKTSWLDLPVPYID
jgi:hypothetical protein